MARRLKMRADAQVEPSTRQPRPAGAAEEEVAAPSAASGAEWRPSEPSIRRTLSGWGRFPSAPSEVFRPERMSALPSLVRSSAPLVPRGCGRSYGDAALNSAGATVLMERLNRFLAFDPETGVLECEAGVTVAELLAYLLPRGFFPPVTPGTKFVTLGGALACDVHGKNHHRDGAISRHVLDLELLTASGEQIRCSRTQHPRLFWATLGGLGLTGCIVRLRLVLKRVESAFLAVDYDRAADLDEALALFAGDDRYAHSVAWIDCVARGRSLGRSILMRGNFLAANALPRGVRENPFRVPPRSGVRVPIDLPGHLLNRFTVRGFNAAYFHSHPRRARGVVRHFEPFFYPLDRVGDWNRVYGKRGFLQYQVVLPSGEAEAGLARLLTCVSAAGGGSFLAVLKRFGPAEPGSMLSFPLEGYTLAMDFPCHRASVPSLLDRLDGITLDHGGRVYLAKDARLRPELLPAMYPSLARWREVKREVDPDNRFTSDLARRLRLES